MSLDFSCPRCHHPIDPQVRYCGQCGVDVALAAMLAEPVVLNPIPIPVADHLSPEALVPRLGDYLINDGLLDPSQLATALEFQKKKIAAGEPILLGQALVELGSIERSTLDEVITKQVLQLQRTLQESNRKLEERVAERTADLQQALVRLTELNQLKSNFLSNVSHELRTPLTHIKGYLEILSDQSLGPLTPLQSDVIGVLKRSESRLETLIDDLIQLSLAARGEITTQLKQTFLVAAIKPIIGLSEDKARSKDITMEVQIAVDLPPVMIDEQKIGWVINQLIDNAIKFTPRGGQVSFSASHNSEHVTIAVRDTGIGIPPERISEIFVPFHQLDGSANRSYPGTGLGLAMVKRILDAHSTPIKVESIVGEGSVFEFSLPLAED
jgi:signal transduction histidine kinase